MFDGLALGAGWDVDPGAVQAPTILWYGGADEVCPPTYGQWYADRIAGAQLTVFPGEDHLAMGDAHRPEMLAAVLKAWR